MRSRINSLRGLYAITDSTLCARRGIVADVASAIRGGAVMIQYRDKSTDASRRLLEASQLQEICAQSGVVFIVNDDVELARAAGAAGVHLGNEDAKISSARERLGTDAIIGVSCYASLDSAREAQSAGADYVGFGSFFASPTKPHAVYAPLQLLHDVRREIKLPIAAIGGLSAVNGRALIEAGADLLAMISGIFGTDDVEQSARAVTNLFSGTSK